MNTRNDQSGGFRLASSYAVSELRTSTYYRMQIADHERVDATYQIFQRVWEEMTTKRIKQQEPENEKRIGRLVGAVNQQRTCRMT